MSVNDSVAAAHLTHGADQRGRATPRTALGAAPHLRAAGNVVTLGVDYRLTDGAGQALREVPVVASSKDQYAGSEVASAILVGAFFNIGKMKESSGAAWDQATMNAIGPLLDALLALEKTP
ncbi:MAG: hypothetical protein AB1938_24545 [Myxococcota bacterium]